MNTLAPERFEMNSIERYTILVAYVGMTALWFKTSQFAAVTVIDALAVGYGLAWAAVAAQIVLAGIAAIVYLISRGAREERPYQAALLSLGVSVLASGLAWAIMAWAAR